MLTSIPTKKPSYTSQQFSTSTVRAYQEVKLALSLLGILNIFCQAQRNFRKSTMCLGLTFPITLVKVPLIEIIEKIRLARINLFQENLVLLTERTFYHQKARY